MNTDFHNELEDGYIHFRDNLQFELKSEFSFKSDVKQNRVIQEFYLFVPESLQINSHTYPKSQFYLDETSLIRYKTPNFTFAELSDASNSRSPITRIKSLCNKTLDPKNKATIIYEIKLYGSVFRSTLRKAIAHLINVIKAGTVSDSQEEFAASLHKLCLNVSACRAQFLELKEEIVQKYEDATLRENFNYVDEFISTVIEQYLTGFIQKLRTLLHANLAVSDEQLCKLVIAENVYREKHHLKAIQQEDTSSTDAANLFRQGLLHKFMNEPLHLLSSRAAVIQTHAPILGAVAAGVSMLVYMALFVYLWQHPLVVMNSTPFVASVVFFYILKDRIKEGLKSYYQKKAVKWFPDYRITIYNQARQGIGQLNESFMFKPKEEIPPDILKERNQGFHNDLDSLQRHETVIHYERELSLFPLILPPQSRRRNELVIIFRLNLIEFLEKASNPYVFEPYLTPETSEIIYKQIPKVYHLDIILKNTQFNNLNQKIEEFKKFRIILDKTGIKRVENVNC